jgi:hypothetical protein
MPLPLENIAKRLNSVTKTIRFHASHERLWLETSAIHVPTTYEQLPKAFLERAKAFDLVLIATSIRYANNFFFEEYENVVLMSFSNWNMLTDLPISNGLAFFASSLIGDSIDLGISHTPNIGCVNDFWVDKRGVDAGMRSAYVCSSCLNTDPVEARHKPVLEDMMRLLNLVSSASRNNADIVDLDGAVAESQFDTFLCHNSGDKSEVRRLGAELGAASIRCWLDEEQIRPGQLWQAVLESQISSVRSALVCVGASGLGPWQNLEMRTFINEFATRGCPVVPVLLPSLQEAPELPLFLRQLMWVNMGTDQQALPKLIWAITGRRPT